MALDEHEIHLRNNGSTKPSLSIIEKHEFVLLTSSRYIPRAVSPVFPCTVVPVDLVVKGHLNDVDDGGIM